MLFNLIFLKYLFFDNKWFFDKDVLLDKRIELNFIIIKWWLLKFIVECFCKWNMCF